MACLKQNTLEVVLLWTDLQQNYLAFFFNEIKKKEQMGNLKDNFVCMCACMSVLVHKCMWVSVYTQKPEEGVGSLEAGATGVYWISRK